MSRNDKARLRRRTIGYVFQDFNLLAGLTAVENVSLPLELDGISARKAQRSGHGRARGAGPRGPGGALSRRALRRRTPAGRDRPRRRRRSPPAPGRRAVGRARLDERRGGDAHDPRRLSSGASPRSSSPTTRSSPRGRTGSCSSATGVSSIRRCRRRARSRCSRRAVRLRTSAGNRSPRKRLQVSAPLLTTEPTL